MQDLRHMMRENIISVSILVYILLYMIIVYSRPAFLYNKDGTLRQFGVGYQSKTVIPVWLLAIILSIFSYFIVMYYVNVPLLVN